MSRFPSSPLVLLAFGMAACGGVGSVCNRADEIFGICEGQADVDTCKDNYAECDGDDIDKLNAYFDCWEDEGLGCPEDLETGDLDKAAACVEEIGTLSDACANGTGGT
jgi:hypothetical protein